MNLNLERPLLFFDIESTGLNIATDCIALFEWFPTILREPLSAADTLSEATAPVKLPT